MRAVTFAWTGFVASAPGLADVALEQGRAVYDQTCAVCHGPDGAGGMPGVPDFNDPAGPLSKPDAVLLKSTIEGSTSPGSPMAMPPKGGNPALTESEIMAVLAYIRSRFGAAQRK